MCVCVCVCVNEHKDDFFVDELFTNVKHFGFYIPRIFTHVFFKMSARITWSKKCKKYRIYDSLVPETKVERQR